jgi:7-carboxy-7-deazaguanine synthase
VTYKVKEIFYTLQGEGTHAGRPAVFCRFSSCNLWTGREADRERAICKFCDTDFVGTDGEEAGSLLTPMRSQVQSQPGGQPTPAGSPWSCALGESHFSSWMTKQSAR